MGEEERAEMEEMYEMGKVRVEENGRCGLSDGKGDRNRKKKGNGMYINDEKWDRKGDVC